MIIDNDLRQALEDYNIEALNILKENGIENGTKISVTDEDGKTKKGELLVAGENPEINPVIWFKGRRQLVPLSEFVLIIKT